MTGDHMGFLVISLHISGKFQRAYRLLHVSFQHQSGEEVLGHGTLHTH